MAPRNVCPACPVGQNDRTGVNSFSACLVPKNDRISVECLNLVNQAHVNPLGLGEERAEYGKRVIEDLSNRLTERYEKGFSVTYLRNFRKFYVMFQDRKPEIRYPLGSELMSHEFGGHNTKLSGH